MYQSRKNRVSNLNTHVFSKTKKNKKNKKKTYDINSIFYCTIIKNFTISTKQSNKLFVSNNIVSNDFRIEIQIFQQQKLISEKKKNTHY